MNDTECWKCRAKAFIRHRVWKLKKCKRVFVEAIKMWRDKDMSDKWTFKQYYDFAWKVTR